MQFVNGEEGTDVQVPHEALVKLWVDCLKVLECELACEDALVKRQREAVVNKLFVVDGLQRHT